MYLKLGNQTTLVYGDYSALLMDFHRGIMQRVSLDTANLVREVTERGSIDIAKPSSTEETRVISMLVDRGFLHYVSAKGAREFSADWEYPIFPLMRTLSIECKENIERHTDVLMECLRNWHKSRGLLSVTLFCVDAIPRAAEIKRFVYRLLAETSYLVVDLVVPDGGGEIFADLSKGSQGRVLLSRLPMSHMPGSPEFVIPPVRKESLFCRRDFFHLLQKAGESYGCLHMDSRGNIYPDAAEAQFVVGRVNELTHPDRIDELIHASKPYWGAHKNVREKCSGCEYRLACPNTVAARSNALDLNSAPRNCQYSPQQGSWG